MVIIIVESVRVTQVEEPTASTDTRDSVLHTSMDEPSLVKSALVVVTPEAAMGTVPEMPVITLVLKAPAASLVPEISETASDSTDTVRIIIERGPRSAPVELAPAMDIMKELAHQMVQQFFTFIKSCIELVLFGRSSFEFS